MKEQDPSQSSVRAPEQYNLAEDFVDRHLAQGRADKTAIIAGDHTLTYRALAKLVNQVGNGLRGLGIQEEQRVLLVLPDGPEFAAAYFGTIKIGAVAVPTSTAIHSADYSYFLTESRARAVIVHSSLLAQVGPALSGQPYLKHVIVCGEQSQSGIGWGEWLSGCSTELEAAPTSKEDVAFWLWTSGSTGRPKAAVHLHGDWAYSCKHYGCGVLGIGPDDITFSSSKLYHAYGLGNGLMFPFYVGATTVLFSARPNAKAILETARDQKPTVFFSVPTLYAAMLQEAAREDYDLRSIRIAASAAEPLPAEVFRRWLDRFGVEILDGIGSTEVLHIYISARAGRVKAGSTGQVVPGYQVRIVDADGNDVPSGAIGDLLVAGDSTAPYYWRRRAMTADRMRGRWFFSGDKYWLDDEGFYWYAGRSDDMFRVSGQWVSPIEVESALTEHSCVLEVAVVAFEEDTRLHTPKAFVVLAEGVVDTPELVRELQDFVKQRITPYKYPRRIEFLAELPKNAAGKILRHKLRETNAKAVV